MISSRPLIGLIGLSLGDQTLLGNQRSQRWRPQPHTLGLISGETKFPHEELIPTFFPSSWVEGRGEAGAQVVREPPGYGHRNKDLGNNSPPRQRWPPDGRVPPSQVTDNVLSEQDEEKITIKVQKANKDGESTERLLESLEEPHQPGGQDDREVPGGTERR